jgi:hypothetical protein
LHDSLESIVYYTPVGRYWDSAGQIRSELQVTQREVKATNPNLDKLFGRLEGLAGTSNRKSTWPAEMNRVIGIADQAAISIWDNRMARIDSKQVFVLGKFPLPVEVIGFAEAIVSEKIAALGQPARRPVRITACIKKS